MPWSPSNDPSLPHPSYERPLGLPELGFYYDSLLNRTADVVRVIEVVRSDVAMDTSPEKVIRIWERLKQRSPLLGSKLVETGNVVKFVVSVEWLSQTQQDEVTFLRVSSREEVSSFATDLVNTNLLLSGNRLARLFILKHDNGESLHVVVQTAHYITDGVGQISILKAFMDHLSTPPEEWPELPSLDHALGLSLSWDELLRSRHQSVPARRWKLAIAQVISSKRMMKLKGGHTLPRTLSPATRYTPAKSGRIACHLTPEQSSRAIQTCREHGITFGSAHAILSQVALSRVLIRRYIKGLIPEDEWQFRKTEPMIVAGPINLKPSLDKEWYNGGGKNNVSLAIGFFFYTVPSMPVGGFKEGQTNIPDFSALLHPGRFFLRCKEVKKQSDMFVKHPLVAEMTLSGLPGRVARIRKQAEDMRVHSHTAIPSEELEPWSVKEQAGQGFVIGIGGSSLGNVDLLLPASYPVCHDNVDKSSTFQITNSETYLHCRPSELYLGASTNQGKLHFFVFWDRNVFEDEVISEWLEEVKQATVFYLAQEGA